MILESIAPLISLIVLEVILGIDNIIFISILAAKLPEKEGNKLRYWGIGLAMIMRLVLLGVIAWILKLEISLFTVLGNEISGKDLILIAGGLFLLYKSTTEIFEKTETEDDGGPEIKGKRTFGRLLIEALLLDIIFSIDSIITAVGLVEELWIMYTAVIVTVFIMLAASKSISNFIHKHPSFKVLALCFLMMIGVSLLAEGFGYGIPKGYIYFSMAFAFFVDIVQIRALKKNT